MAINKKILKKLTRDYIVPLGRAKSMPPSMFDEVARPDWKLESPLQVKKAKKSRK